VGFAFCGAGRGVDHRGTARLSEIFQSDPRHRRAPGRGWWPYSRVDQADLIERPLHPPEIARRAGDDHVIERAFSAMTVWQDVIVLEPHALKRRVLDNIFSTPSERVGYVAQILFRIDRSITGMLQRLRNSRDQCSAGR
jgi:hypothetical protein